MVKQKLLLLAWGTIWILSQPAGFSQSSSRPDFAARADESFVQSFSAGFKDSFTKLDLPLLTIFAITEQQREWYGFKVPPLRLEQELSEEIIRRDGDTSFGAINPRLYPSIVASSRLAAVMALDIVGIKHFPSTTYQKLFRFHLALFYNRSLTHLAKRNIHRRRPDQTDTQSLYSGHTSAVFATSTYLFLEINDFLTQLERQDALPLFSEGVWKAATLATLYGWAAYVGYTRMYDGKHYLSDVLLGAAAGSLVSYLVYPKENPIDERLGLRLNLQPMIDGARFSLGMRF